MQKSLVTPCKKNAFYLLQNSLAGKSIFTRYLLQIVPLLKLTRCSLHMKLHGVCVMRNEKQCQIDFL